MTESADVVIIGSGVFGSSVAYHLALAGCANALVIDCAGHHKASTGKSMGGGRAQF
jgi:sarcosine oxidase, subunit beta